jgi:L-lactate dehydrogenase
LKVAVWGAGKIGSAVVRRLTTLTSVSQVRWVNRSTVVAEVLDIEHGLSFAPSCHHISAHAQEEAREVLETSDMLVLTLGARVPVGGTRAGVFAENRAMYLEQVLPVVRDFTGVILVVTNPVDLVAREIGKEGGIDPSRVVGLGTVVETARLQAALASHLQPWVRPADVHAFAVGTHDPMFIPVAVRERLCPTRSPEEFLITLEMARVEVTKAAACVKELGAAGTLHPIVEGVASIVDTVSADKRSILTVSTHDPGSGFWYSVPCVVGRAGVVRRCLDLIPEVDFTTTIEALRATVERASRLR